MSGREGSSPARPVRADARRNQHRLVTAARHLFYAEGTGVTDEAIASRAGLGLGTLHRHFPDRTALIEAVLAQDQAALADQATMLLGSVAPANALAIWLRAAGGALIQIDQLLTGVHNPAARAELRRRELAEWEEPTARLLARAMSAGTCREATNAGDLLALLDAIVRAGADDPARLERLQAIMLDGLRPQAMPAWPGVPVQPGRPNSLGLD